MPETNIDVQKLINRMQQKFGSKVAEYETQIAFLEEQIDVLQEQLDDKIEDEEPE